MEEIIIPEKYKIDVEDITTGGLNGTGDFDILFRTMATHLDAEFSKNRLRGTDYATVYMGTAQMVMSESIKFALSKHGAELNAASTLASILKIEADTALAEEQLAKLRAETKLIEQQTLNAVTQNNVMLQQIAKLVAETELTGLKGKTEIAQTVNVAVDEKDHTDGIIGAQRRVYRAQHEGFNRNAEQQLAKLMADAFNVQYTTLDGLDIVPADFNLGSQDVAAVMEKAAEGVGVNIRG